MAAWQAMTRSVRRGATIATILSGVALGVAGSAAAAPVADVQPLLEKNGCSACHRVNEKLVGPAFHDVAAQYKSNKGAVEQLLAAVRDGPRGVWGEVPMPPYDEDRISDADLQSILEWILAQ